MCLIVDRLTWVSVLTEYKRFIRQNLLVVFYNVFINWCTENYNASLICQFHNIKPKERSWYCICSSDTIWSINCIFDGFINWWTNTHFPNHEGNIKLTKTKGLDMTSHHICLVCDLMYLYLWQAFSIYILFSSIRCLIADSLLVIFHCPNYAYTA